MPRPQARTVWQTGASATTLVPDSGTILRDASPEVSNDVPISGAGKIALYLSLAFIFLRFSFLHEFLMSKVSFDTHLLLVIGGAAVLANLLSGGLLNGIQNRITLVWLGFAVCMVLATVTSTWRGGSFSVLYPYLRTTMILAVLIPAVVTSSRSLSQMLRTIGFAGLALLILGLTVNDFRSGRLELSAAGSSIANANDYAAILILVMPAIAYSTMGKGSSMFFRIIGLLALALGSFLVLSTGSRGALISIGISAIYLLKVSPGKIRLAILIGIPVAALIAIPFLPAEASQRLGSLFSSQSEADEAAASKQERTALLMASLQITAQHPLLGTGPGTFEVNEAQEAKSRGQRGMWHESHNSYTQISSECGVPALICYLSGIVMSFLVFQRGRKSPDPNIRSVSSVLGLMLVSFSVCMFFLSQAYGFGFPVFGGLAVAIELLMRRQADMSNELQPAIA